ncbi:hypothetical protein D1AOALGA4SA_7149 [Olavius algarvensis Delta 1 endosymbiont]|nr:hypothetical protein D1AOALGA4SA_7149 [Olavius algarvensis Delta 1 endosymbiont]
MLECWVYLNGIYFHKDRTDQFIQSDRHPLSIPNIPFFHHSNIPLGV